MDLLLRELYVAVDQGQEFLDRELSSNEITIGSAQDQLIQLIGIDIKSAHLVLKESDGVVNVKCMRGCKVSINDKLVGSAAISQGDVLKLGGHSLKVFKAPSGFDLALELDPDQSVDSSVYQYAYRTKLTDTWLSKRKPAWILAAAVLLLGGFLPALFMSGDGETSWRAFLPTDKLWISGPLLPAHNVAMGDDCSACHRIPFQQVQDEACLSCHTNLSDHVVLNSSLPGQDAIVGAASTEVGRCASCHKEHNEPAYMVVDSDALCTDCHNEPDSLEGTNPHMQKVSGFSESDHPAFEVALLVPEQTNRATGALFDWQVVERRLAGATESSNLKFPHDLHLDVEKVRNTNDGTALGCDACHTLSADMEHFVPISMEAHCQACHELTFDVSSPDRQLPHGHAIEAIFAMEGYFMRSYSNPKKQSAVVRRRLPDKRAERFDCNESAFDCAERRTREEAVNQFSLRGCVTCHEVEDFQTDDIYTRFQVHPVRLSQDFIPSAIFDHRSHLTQKDAEGDKACLSCHPATQSGSSTELLIPDLDNCLGCHSDHSIADTVALDCIDCHAYHPVGHKPASYLSRSL
ncbi:MAG: cytochrome c3 family protein [Pseudomonadales bacterium]|nr:cytochrome c3 family protein [Pseudomonadales bacterium]